MAWVALITAVSSAVAVVASVLLLRRQTVALVDQTRLVADQTRLATEQAKRANDMVAVSGNTQALRDLDQILLLFVPHPQLRRYFNDGAAPPDRSDVREQVEVIAEVLADAVTGGLISTRIAPLSSDAWESYARYLWLQSPAFKGAVTKHPDWWPELTSVVMPFDEAQTEQAPQAREAVIP